MKVRKAVFPAAGLGTRFLPATKAQPKEMLPLVDKPVIQYVVEEALASGIEHVIVVTGRGKRAIEDHFDVSVELERFLAERGKDDLLVEVRAISDMGGFSYVRQKEPLGLGHAVLAAKVLVGNEPFAVFLGDDLIEAKVPAMKQLMDVFEKTGNSVLAVERVPRAMSDSYGIVKVKEGKGRIHEVLDLVEKPRPEDAPSDLAIIGRYILTPEIFGHIEKTAADAKGEIQLTDALRSLLTQQPIQACEFEGKRYDTGHKLGFLKATVEFALKRPDLGPQFREYLKTLRLD